MITHICLEWILACVIVKSDFFVISLGSTYTSTTMGFPSHQNIVAFSCHYKTAVCRNMKHGHCKFDASECFDCHPGETMLPILCYHLHANGKCDQRDNCTYDHHGRLRRMPQHLIRCLLGFINSRYNRKYRFADVPLECVQYEEGEVPFTQYRDFEERSRSRSPDTRIRCPSSSDRGRKRRRTRSRSRSNSPKHNREHKRREASRSRSRSRSRNREQSQVRQPSMEQPTTVSFSNGVEKSETVSFYISHLQDQIEYMNSKVLAMEQHQASLTSQISRVENYLNLLHSSLANMHEEIKRVSTHQAALSLSLLQPRLHPQPQPQPQPHTPVHQQQQPAPQTATLPSPPPQLPVVLSNRPYMEIMHQGQIQTSHRKQ